jgi:ribose transport system substrate-binding protein
MPMLSMTRRGLIAGILTASSLTALPAWSQDGKTIAISFPNSSTIGAVTISLDRAKAYGAEKGFQVVVDDPGADMNRQVNTLKTWIQQGVPVIVAVVPQPAVFETIAKEARASGIKWITYGETLENQDATVGYAQYDDGFRLGEYAGKWITETQGGKANVAILGYEVASWGQLRGKGIRDGLTSTAPGATIVAEQDAINPSDGLAVTRTLLQANPDINVILGIEDPATEGAYRAWVAAGKDPKDPNGFIGGMDGTPPALELLKAGDTVYRASMAIPLLEVGEAIVDTSQHLLAGESTGNVIVPLELVTAGAPSAAKYLQQQGVN